VREREREKERERDRPNVTEINIFNASYINVSKGSGQSIILLKAEKNDIASM